MKFKTHYNAKDFPDPGERSIQPSLTIPDQSMSIQEMIDRHRRGLPIRGYADAEYTDQADILEGRDLRQMDLEEIKQLSKKLRKNYEDARDKWYKEETERRQAAQRQAIIDEYEKEKKKGEAQPQ